VLDPPAAGTVCALLTQGTDRVRGNTEATACTNQGFKSLVPQEGVVREFAYFWLWYWAAEIDAAAPSTTFREVNKKSMERQPFPLPPTAEQKRIVRRAIEILGAPASAA
jgi:restriction endonuclease S subunit